MIRYHETGESRTFADVPGRPLALIWMYALSGQLDRSVELFADLVRPGAYGWAAHTHVRFTSGLLGDHSRYQALLEEAGITW